MSYNSGLMFNQPHVNYSVLFGDSLRELSLIESHLQDHNILLNCIQNSKRMIKLDLTGNQWSIPVVQVLNDIFSELLELRILLLGIKKELLSTSAAPK